MTAKSETVGVVAWQYRFQDDVSANWAPWQEANSQESAIRFAALYAKDGFNTETRALVPESALAELQTKLEEEVCDFLRLHQQHVYLLSGLEALAGELDAATRSPDVTVPQYTRLAGMAAEFRALIPAAANTESEETK